MAPLMATRWRVALQRWLPNTLFGRLALLLIVAVIASHVLALTLMFELRPAHPERPPGPPGPPPHWAVAQERPQPPPGQPPYGERPGFWNAPPSLQLGLLLDISVRLAALVAVAWWAARWLSRPIHRLATAAQQLGRDIDRPPLPEDGTLECRDASRVFNQMQARIRQQLAERDRFVAAVSHDPRAQELFRRDIAEMDAMIASTLDDLRGAAGERSGCCWMCRRWWTAWQTTTRPWVVGSRWPGRHHPCMCGPWRCDAVWTTGWALPFATAVALKSPCVTLPML